MNKEYKMIRTKALFIINCLLVVSVIFLYNCSPQLVEEIIRNPNAEPEAKPSTSVRITDLTTDLTSGVLTIKWNAPTTTENILNFQIVYSTPDNPDVVQNFHRLSFAQSHTTGFDHIYTTTTPLVDGFGLYSFAVQAELSDRTWKPYSPFEDIYYASYVTYQNTITSFNATELTFPMGMVLVSNNIYLCDSQNSRILKLDTSGNYVTAYGTLGSGQQQFNHPTDITLGFNHKLFVTDSWNERIVMFDPANFDDFTTWTFSDFGQSENYEQTLYPKGITSDNPHKTIYFTDSDGARICQIIFNADGTVSSNTTLIYSPDHCASPSDILYHNGYLYLLQNHYLTKLSASTGSFVAKTLGYGNANRQFDTPMSLTIDTVHNYLYVADTNNHRIQVLDTSLGFQYTFGILGIQPGEFNLPTGILYTNTNLYITDSKDPSLISSHPEKRPKDCLHIYQ
jgi:DNA-binding beta-propeller fold protein YncE